MVCLTFSGFLVFSVDFHLEITVGKQAVVSKTKGPPLVFCRFLSNFSIPTLYCITLYYTILYYTTLHYIILRYITLYFIYNRLVYSVLYFVLLYYIIFIVVLLYCILLIRKVLVEQWRSRYRTIT